MQCITTLHSITYMRAILWTPSEIEHLTVKTQGNAVYYNPTQYFLYESYTLDPLRNRALDCENTKGMLCITTLHSITYMRAILWTPSEVEHLTVKPQGNAVYYNPTGIGLG